ncbi:hypothetical protein [Metarhizobium album]|uniref:hypothetical protein n=1 Tax=Metarhizobium album TaxID=2182425 RepID=UPI00140275CD|nr:hypothetical protein [Rhizobium album]
MAKAHDKIDRNYFIPSRSPVCRVLETVLIWSVAVAGIVAGISTIVFQLGAMR